MDKMDAAQFWLRYKKLAGKDFPVILSTDIKQSTLSTWRKRKLFPRADQAYLIAESIGATVEYLLTGENKNEIPYSKAMSDVLRIANELSDDGMTILLAVARCLLYEFPKKR